MLLNTTWIKNAYLQSIPKDQEVLFLHMIGCRLSHVIQGFFDIIPGQGHAPFLSRGAQFTQSYRESLSGEGGDGTDERTADRMDEKERKEREGERRKAEEKR